MGFSSLKFPGNIHGRRCRRVYRMGLFLVTIVVGQGPAEAPHPGRMRR